MPNAGAKVLTDRIPLAIVTAREPVANNPWISERWRVVKALLADPGVEARITRTLLKAGPEGEQYLWSGFVLHLHPAEADAYYYNVIGQNPSLYVYCEHDESGEPRPRSITAEYIEAMTHSEMGNATYNVAMPPEVLRLVEQYALAHYEPEEPKMNRKRDHGRRGVWNE